MCACARVFSQVLSGLQVPGSSCCPLTPTGRIPRLFMAVAQAPRSPRGTLRCFCSALSPPAPSAAAPHTHTPQNLTHTPPAGDIIGRTARHHSSSRRRPIISPSLRTRTHARTEQTGRLTRVDLQQETVNISRKWETQPTSVFVVSQHALLPELGASSPSASHTHTHFSCSLSHHQAFSRNVFPVLFMPSLLATVLSARTAMRRRSALHAGMFFTARLP